MTNQEAITILECNAINATGTLAALPPSAEERSGLNQQIEALDMAIDAMKKQTEYQKRIKGLVNTIEDICKNSRDRHVDDEHCGLCEYDGAYVGESGEWANECPGFDADDCFVLSKGFRNKYIDWSEEE